MSRRRRAWARPSVGGPVGGSGASGGWVEAGVINEGGKLLRMRTWAGSVWPGAAIHCPGVSECRSVVPLPRPLASSTDQHDASRLFTMPPMDKAVYAISALRWDGSRPVEVMMGLLGEGRAHWDVQPTPTAVHEVVDRLVEGDLVLSVFDDCAGGLDLGPEVKVDVLHEGTETLALAIEKPGRQLHDLLHF